MRLMASEDILLHNLDLLACDFLTCRRHSIPFQWDAELSSHAWVYLQPHNDTGFQVVLFIRRVLIPNFIAVLCAWTEEISAIWRALLLNHSLYRYT